MPPDGRRRRQGRDHHQGRPVDAVQRLPQPGHRALSHVHPDRRQLHRLHDEPEADRPDRSEARHGEARHRHHRQPHRPARAGREVRAAVRPVRLRLRNPGAAARRGRSGAREGADRHGGGARDRRREGRSVPEPRSGAGAARRHAAARTPKLVRSKPRGSGDGEQWYLVSKTPGDHRPRDAQRAPRPGRVPQVGNQLHAVAGRRQALRPLHRGQIGNHLAVVLDNQIVSVATIQSQDRRFRPHHRPGQRGGSRRSVALPAFRLAAGRREVQRRALGRALAGRRFDSRRASSPASPA